MFIIGCGKLGTRIAQCSSRTRQEIYGLIKREDAAKDLSPYATPVLADIDQLSEFPSIPAQAQWIYTVPPLFGGPSREDERVQNFINKIPKTHIPARVLYISTTGVYGDCQGAWVDESHPVRDIKSPTQPDSIRSDRRISAEQQWQKWCDANGVELIIARVPGIIFSDDAIYERARNSTAVLHSSIAPYVNLVRVDYLAKACLFLISKASAGIYNIADQAPINSTQRILNACDELGIDYPKFVDMQEAEQIFSPMQMSFLKESKRINCDKLHKIFKI